MFAFKVMATVQPAGSQYQSDIEQGCDTKISSSKWLKNLNIDFPLFTTDESFRAYITYASESINPVVIVPAIFVYFALVACRCGLVGFESTYFTGDDSTVVGVRLAAVVFYFLFFCFSCLYFAVHYLRLTGRDQLFMVLKKWLPGRLEEKVLYAGIVSWSLFLIARVLKGPCATNITVWQQQTCNPFANNGGIPTELVYSLYLMPTFAQLVIKSNSIRFISMSYLVILTVVAFCIFYSKSNDYFVLINAIFFINITFEILRLQRVNYVEMLKVKKHEKITLAQLKQEQVTQELVLAQELLLHRAEDEKRLKEAEAVQLRSLMGNVAHDLKTPLVRVDFFPVESVIDSSYLI